MHHADVNAQCADASFSLVHIVCGNERTAIVEFLISVPGINVNLALGDERMRWTPLYMTCMAGSAHAVRQLLALPQIQANAVTTRAVSSLHMACTEQKAEVMEAQLRHPDVDVNLTPKGGELSPLAAASHAGKSAIVALLLQHPAIYVNATNMQLMSPLFWASANGHAHVVRMLLRLPDIRVNTIDGMTNLDLHVACINGNLVVIRELLLYPGLDEGSVRAALRAAVGRGEAAVVALLRGHRAVRRALRGRGGA